MTQAQTIADPGLIKAVEHGLSGEHKSLPSWLFYDEQGDRIFQKIMRMPEYYPTRCEYDIFNRHKEDLLYHFNTDNKPFQLIELGAGDGLKTEILLKHFYSRTIRFTYVPVDISGAVLSALTSRLTDRLPGLEIQPVNKSYLQAMEELRSDEKKVLFFLGATIGNFPLQEALGFIRNITSCFKPGDMILIGFDLKKDPRIILDAYDDKRRITKEFNLNMLTRLNRELSARFNLDQFDHYATYDPETGAARSFLISLQDQDVPIQALNRSFHFAKWETIQTEISQKYDLLMIEHLLSGAGLKITGLFFDVDHYFCDVLAKKF